jgi:hypothetical protein
MVNKDCADQPCDWEAKRKALAVISAFLMPGLISHPTYVSRISTGLDNLVRLTGKPSVSRLHDQNPKRINSEN